MQLKHASFFAGIAGFELGIKAAGASNVIKTELFIENNPDAQRVLKYRFPSISIHSDIKDYYPNKREFNLYTIGFPCTGTSIAGNGTGLDHPESKLWFEALRCIADGRPSFIIIENPTGLVNKGLRGVIGGLRMVGYVWDDPQIISAAELGSPHQRERLFIVAYTNNVLQRLNGMQTSWGDQIGAEIEAIYIYIRKFTRPNILSGAGTFVMARIQVGFPSSNSFEIGDAYLHGKMYTCNSRFRQIIVSL